MARLDLEALDAPLRAEIESIFADAKAMMRSADHNSREEDDELRLYIAALKIGDKELLHSLSSFHLPPPTPHFLH